MQDTMLSHTLMQMLTDHRDQISQAAVKRIQKDEKTLNLDRLSEAGFEEWPGLVLQALDSWAPGNNNKELIGRYQPLGRACYEQLIPLHEILRGIQLLKIEAIDFARSRAFTTTTLEIYAEEELEHRLSLFFDWIIYQLVLGFEQAQAERREPGKSSAKPAQGWFNAGVRRR